MVERVRCPLRLASLFSLAATMVLVSCGRESSSVDPTDDAGADSTTVDAAPEVDASVDSLVEVLDTGGADTHESGPPDEGVDAPLMPGQLYRGLVTLVGVTSDDFAIVTDPASDALLAIPLAGGVAQAIDVGSSAQILSGKVVFSFKALDATSTVGTLTVWSASTGSKELSKTAVYSVDTAASVDGSTILYVDNLDASRAHVDLMFARSDGSARKAIAAGSPFGSGCILDDPRPIGAQIIVALCAGKTQQSLHVIDVATGSDRFLTGARSGWSVDDAGKLLFAVDDVSRDGKVVAVDGSSRVTIESADAKRGVLTRDGTQVLLSTTTDALKLSPTSTGAPAALGLTGSFFSILSPDSRSFVFWKAFGPTGVTTDLYLAPVAAPATAIALSAEPTSGNVADLFTRDSRFALYLTNVDDTFTGQLRAMPVAGGAAISLGTGAVRAARALTGSFVAYVEVAASAIFVVDAATGKGAKSIADSSDGNVFTSHARDRVVFTRSDDGTKEGLYALPAP